MEDSCLHSFIYPSIPPPNPATLRILAFASPSPIDACTHPSFCASTLSSFHRPSTHPCILKSTTAALFNRCLKLLIHICIELSILLSVFHPPIFEHILFFIHSLIVYPYLQSFFLLSMLLLIKLSIYLSFTFAMKI